MPRFLKLEPALVGSIAAAVYAAAIMLYRATIDHSGVFEPDVLVAAITFVYGLFTRSQVTPVENPKSAHGLPLRTGQR